MQADRPPTARHVAAPADAGFRSARTVRWNAFMHAHISDARRVVVGFWSLGTSVIWLSDRLEIPPDKVLVIGELASTRE